MLSDRLRSHDKPLVEYVKHVLCMYMSMTRVPFEIRARGDGSNHAVQDSLQFYLFSSVYYIYKFVLFNHNLS